MRPSTAVDPLTSEGPAPMWTVPGRPAEEVLPSQDSLRCYVAGGNRASVPETQPTYVVIGKCLVDPAVLILLDTACCSGVTVSACGFFLGAAGGFCRCSRRCAAGGDRSGRLCSSRWVHELQLGKQLLTLTGLTGGVGGFFAGIRCCVRFACRARGGEAA